MEDDRKRREEERKRKEEEEMELENDRKALAKVRATPNSSPIPLLTDSPGFSSLAPDALDHRSTSHRLLIPGVSVSLCGVGSWAC